MRLFGGNRMDSISNMMEKTGATDDMPIQAGMVSKAIESAQRQVEAMHFAARKNVLEYDDVMNLQRNAIYAERNAILDGKDLSSRIDEIVDDEVAAVIEENCPAKLPSDDWDMKAVDVWAANMTGEASFKAEDANEEDDAEALEEALSEYLVKTYRAKEETIGADAMRQLESQVMLRIIDVRWMNHLQAMDYLKTGIGLRAFGQRDPLVEYKEEAHRAFAELTTSMYEDFLRTLLRLRIAAPVEQEEASPLDGKVSYSSPEAALSENTISNRRAQPAARQGQPKPAPAPEKPKTYRKDEDEDPYANVGRNDLCPCGSGKKFKKCHGMNR